MTDKETPIAAILFFRMRPKIFRQDFVIMNTSCEFETSTNNTLCPRGPRKLLSENKKNPCGGHLVFQNEAENIPRQDFMVMNISCKFEKASYNIFLVRAVTVKSLYTLRRQHNEAKSIVSNRCYTVDTIMQEYLVHMCKNSKILQNLPFRPIEKNIDRQPKSVQI